MEHGRYDSRDAARPEGHKRKVVDLGAASCSTPSAACCARAACASAARSRARTRCSSSTAAYHADRHREQRPIERRLHRQPRRRLPGGRAHVEGLPLQDARVVPEERRVGLPRLLDGLQHPRRPQGRRGASLRAAAQRRGQQVLDLRLRSRPVARRAGGSHSLAAAARGRERARGDVGRGARAGGRQDARGGRVRPGVGRSHRFATAVERGQLARPSLRARDREDAARGLPRRRLGRKDRTHAGRAVAPPGPAPEQPRLRGACRHACSRRRRRRGHPRRLLRGEDPRSSPARARRAHRAP